MKQSFFVLVTLFVCLLAAAPVRAQGQQDDEPPRLEAGVHFSALTLTPSVGYRTEAGFGGRLTFNVTPHFALEAETTFFPNSGRSAEPRAGGRAVQGLFGAKAGRRWEKFGVFAKARPGLVSFGEGRFVPGDFFTDGVFGVRKERATHFATDVGGVLELYVTRRLVTRFDFGDTIIRYRGQTFTATDFSGHSATFIIPDDTRHNFQFNAGIGWRF